MADPGLGTCVEPALRRLPAAEQESARRRLADAMACEVDGVRLPDAVGGFGLAVAAEVAWEHVGDPGRPARVAVQGFGAFGVQAAICLQRRGLRVCRVSDSLGEVDVDPSASMAALREVTAAGVAATNSWWWLVHGVVEATAPASQDKIEAAMQMRGHEVLSRQRDGRGSRHAVAAMAGCRR